MACERLRRLNPDIEVVKHPFRIDSENAAEILKDYDVIIDAVDNFPARYIVSDCCYFLKKPLVEGAVLGFSGILTTIIPGKTPCYRCIYPFPPKDGVVPTCSDTGIIGMITGTVGSLQALEALKLIVGIGEALYGRLLVFDGLSLYFREIKLSRNEDCPLCGQNPTINELVQYEMKCKLKTFD